MSSPDSASWTDPEYVATVVAVVAAGTLVFYAASAGTGLTVRAVVFVLLAVTLPATVAYELARRARGT